MPDQTPDTLPASEAIASPDAIDILRLTLADGLGPVLIARAIDTLGSARAVLHASMRDLAHIRGVGERKAETIRRGLDAADELLAQELDLASTHGVRIVARGEPEYPPLIASIPSAPPVLYVRGSLTGAAARFCVGIVGSRRASHYGLEQTTRFAHALAQSGLTIVSGGARGVDTAAHRAALAVHEQSGGEAGATVAVLGCGLAHCYPPENRPVFDDMVERGGAVLSELPMAVAPAPENFPARNRIISGMSLGVLVVEAPAQSGALITARVAAEDQGREVMAIPGRIDSPSAEGTNDLLKSGGAAMVTCPADVLSVLENAAAHAHWGTHEHLTHRDANEPQHGLFQPPQTPRPTLDGLTDRQRRIVEALADPCSFDNLVLRTGVDAGDLLGDVTVLEIRGLLRREGDRFARKG